MGRHNPSKSLIQQVKEMLDSKLAIGESKYDAKINGTHKNYIFSWGTYHSYIKHCCYFINWCKQQQPEPSIGHKPRKLDECRVYAERWIQYGIDRGLSAYTLKLQLSALAKLYGCSTKDFNVKTPPRKRSKITRSRGNAERDKHFSLEENKELITFCQCTGLRRAELSQIRGTDLIVEDGRLFLNTHRNTKGGRARISPVVGSEEELELAKDLCVMAGEGKIFPAPSQNADIHSFRAEYARKIYTQHKRDFAEFKNERLIIYKNQIVNSYISKNGRKNIERFSNLYTTVNGQKRMLPGYRDVSSVYYCRNDKKGCVYDRRALFEASRSLGHHRCCVVAEHYLH